MENFNLSSNDLRLSMVRTQPEGSGTVNSDGNNNKRASSSTNGSIMLDELSIDSATNQKVQLGFTRAMSSQQHQQQSKVKRQHHQQHNHPQQPRPHFRIDWRQLCYFQKPDFSASKIFKKISLSGSGKSHDDFGVESSKKSLPNGQPKQILNSLDGSFKSGQLSAILGPSGAGKSTFLSTLFGSKQESAFGQTKVTWFTDPQASIQKRRSLEIACLPQHDHLLHHLTVYETLMFASKIKNATRQNIVDDGGKNFHKQNVKRVAKMLKLTDCLDTRCGKLSGGQYKRVSIGQELLSEPDVIILDEPTSGLDAMTCLTTIQTLKSIVTKHPICIILTIHQPDVDVFNLFDHIYVIAQGGLAIYEGPPGNIIDTLAQVDLKPPSANYNPARFIVENAFVVEPNSQEFSDYLRSIGAKTSQELSDEFSTSSDEDDGDHDDDHDKSSFDKISMQSKIKRSLLSLTEAISGKEMASGISADGGGKNRKRKDKRPLLNIGIRTLDGKLITSEQLARDKENYEQSERWSILKRLNEIQSSPYRLQQEQFDSSNFGDICTSEHRQQEQQRQRQRQQQDPNKDSSPATPPLIADAVVTANNLEDKATFSSSAKSDYSSSGWSSDNRKLVMDEPGSGANNRRDSHQASFSGSKMNKATSLAHLAGPPSNLLLLDCNKQQGNAGRSLQTVAGPVPSYRDSLSSSSSSSSREAEFVVELSAPETDASNLPSSPNGTKANGPTGGKQMRLKKQFDKRLSAKHNCSKRAYPVWYHAYLLTHRTWLSIIRDPIFFGIQACMHTTIPILLALIFGNEQDEGCPRIGNFDFVDFAYSDSTNLIQATVASIRKSISNVGIVFLEMFVLSFSINCITALVFPLDMYVLLKEYRNGWYSLRSYFFGRTLADLPIPIVLHSIGMALLYFLTGQPDSLWRFSGIIVLVILTSMVAQSVGLTIGALLMKSSQSAVLAAAGIVAPFFALSGFIVRIHTLPLVAQLAAKMSYLYHLLNGFIILRYGFSRCSCKQEDFEQNSEHQIPDNLHTLASIWIGTFSNEYQGSAIMQETARANRTNIDPNIDVVNKMMNAFKMASSFGHEVKTCSDVLPYPMLDFDLRDQDIYKFFLSLVIMLIISRCITFSAIYYKIRSFA